VARDAQGAQLAERAALEALAEGLLTAGVPVAMSGSARPRPRIAFAAPLPRGAEAEADPVDVYLSERLTVADMRRRVARGLPDGFHLVDLEDEWVGAPSLASRVREVSYRAEVEEVDASSGRTSSRPSGPPSGPPDPSALAEAGAQVAIERWDEAAGRGALLIRLARDPAGRLGRPADAVAELGQGFRIVRLVRTTVRIDG
jgi:hypothetical protein